MSIDRIRELDQKAMALRKELRAVNGEREVLIQDMAEDACPFKVGDDLICKVMEIQSRHRLVEIRGEIFDVAIPAPVVVVKLVLKKYVRNGDLQAKAIVITYRAGEWEKVGHAE